MKVFWCWQSDTPGKTGRHLIRDALAEAIEALANEMEMEEPDRPEGERIHLDHDRQNLPGSPDLARAIFEKIDAAAAMVADVTPTGSVPAPDASGAAKPLINSNVAIEIGYALKSRSDAALVMVMNTHYGKVEDLPFDLRHKAGPIMFNLPPTASAEERRRVQAYLKGEFERRVGDVVRSKLRTAAAQKAAPEKDRWLPERAGTRCPFDGGEVIAPGSVDSFRTRPDTRWKDGPKFWLRLRPTRPANLARTELAEKVMQAPGNGPLIIHGGYSSRANKYGFVTYETDYHGEQATTSKVAQYTMSGELWAVDADLIRTIELRTGGPRQKYFPPEGVENTLADALVRYLTILTGTLAIPFPFSLDVGLAGVEGAVMGAPKPPANSYYRNTDWGPCMDDIVTWQTTISRMPTSAHATLIPFFNRMWDAGNIKRPEHMRQE